MPPPLYVLKFTSTPLSLVVIFSYALPSNSPIPQLQVIIAQSLIKEWHVRTKELNCRMRQAFITVNKICNRLTYQSPLEDVYLDFK